MKRPNAQDSTRRNTQAANKKFQSHDIRLKELERRVKRMETHVSESLDLLKILNKHSLKSGKPRKAKRGSLPLKSMYPHP